MVSEENPWMCKSLHYAGISVDFYHGELLNNLCVHLTLHWASSNQVSYSIKKCEICIWEKKSLHQSNHAENTYTH